MTSKKLILFPGAHKTATSLLQAMLESHRNALEARGIAIARRQAYYKTGMRQVLQKKAGADMADTAAWQEMCDAVFGPGWEQSDIILISIENMFGELEPPVYPAVATCLENAARLFPDRKIEVSYYIRRQDTLIESVFIQNIHRGHTEPVETFVQRFEGVTIDWLELLQPVVRQIGRENLSIVPYETIKDGPRKYVVRFFRAFTDMPRGEILSTYDTLGNTNVSLSELGLRIARAGFAEIPDMPTRRKLALLLQREFGVDKYPRHRLPEAFRDETAERHREVNAKLVEQGVLPDHLADHYTFST